MQLGPSGAGVLLLASGAGVLLLARRRKRRGGASGVAVPSLSRTPSQNFQGRDRASSPTPRRWSAKFLGSSWRGDEPSTSSQKVVPTPLILVSDPGQDLDDEMACIMLRHLVEEGLVEVRGIIATLAPAFDRARLMRGTLDLLGLYSCPVGIGSDGGDLDGNHSAKSFEDSASSYMPSAASESCATLTPGLGLLFRLYEEAAPRSLTLCIIASLKDPALFLRDHEALFGAKTKEVVIMGGVEAPPPSASAGDEGVLLVPDTANNNTFDAAASAFFYRRCQEIGVRIVVVSRWAAYAAKMPRDVYDELALSGSSIGWRLRNSQRESIEVLWRRACATDETVRKKLPPRCDRAWFIETFCAGRDEPGRDGACPIWDLVDGFMQYDTIAVLAAVPSLRAKYFAPRPVRGPGRRGAVNLLIGAAQDEPGVSQPEELVRRLQVGFTQGIALNHTPKAHVVVMIQLRWDNMPDVRLTCVMLRALWGLGIIECVGLVVSLDSLNAGMADHVGVDPSVTAACAEAAPAPASNPASNPASSSASNPGGGGGDKGRRGGSGGSEPPPVDMLKRRLKHSEGSKGSLVLDAGIERRRGSRASLEHGGGATAATAAAAAAAVATAAVEAEEKADAKLLEQASEISATLHALGLAHVPVHVVSCDASASEHLRRLYRQAPPVGVTLIVTSTFTEVAAFAAAECSLFRDKTVRVIHMGAAMMRAATDPNTGEASGAHELVPEPTAQNNRLDMRAATDFYARAQSLSVPLVIVSRHLAHACRVPSELFDVLAKHGGRLGETLRDEQRESANVLYMRASAPPHDAAVRRNLPARCDAEWFAKKFCGGEQPLEPPDVAADGTPDVWQMVESINMYNPMVLLAALPPFVDQFLIGTPVTVRGARHQVIGLSAESADCVRDGHLARLRNLIYQCLYTGATSNASEYSLGSPPPLPLLFKGERVEVEEETPPASPASPASPGGEGTRVLSDGSAWPKVQEKLRVVTLASSALDSAGGEWRCDASEAALKRLLLGRKSIAAWHRAEHTLM